ncbi:MAG: FmdB family zinc ribbon protein, partial [Chloroflexota bacterium]
MPIYTYRREDGTTFEIRQKFADDPLEVDPETGQAVTRIVHAAGIVFKGSGFYVNDSKGSKSNLTTPKGEANGNGNGTEASAKSENGTSGETKSESKPAATETDR